MTSGERSETNADIFWRRRVGGGVVIVGSVLMLVSLFWLPFVSLVTVEASENRVVQRVSWSEGAYALYELALNNFTAYLLLGVLVVVVLVVLFAALRGWAEVSGRSLPVKMPGLSSNILLFCLLILAFVVQAGAAFFATPRFLYYNPCLQVPNTCTGTYTELRGDLGMWMAFVSFACLGIGWALFLSWQDY